MNYGRELIAELNAERTRITAQYGERFDQDLDDCFLSHRHDQSQLAEIDLKLEILNNNGMHDFKCLRDKDTEEVVSTKIIEGKFGLCWLISDAFKGKFGTFVGMAARPSTYAKKGLVESTVSLPAWVAIKFGKNCGKGLAAAVSGAAAAFPSNRNYFTGESV